MIKIEIENPCSCVKKRKSWTKDLEFTTREEAQKVVFQMCEQGNEKFCKRHSFEFVKGDESIKILVSPKKK